MDGHAALTNGATDEKRLLKRCTGFPRIDGGPNQIALTVAQR